MSVCFLCWPSVIFGKDKYTTADRYRTESILEVKKKLEDFLLYNCYGGANKFKYSMFFLRYVFRAQIG